MQGRRIQTAVSGSPLPAYIVLRGYPLPAAPSAAATRTPGKELCHALIVCRSLTYAQRTASALERAGITAHIMRSPKSIAGEGCSHSVKVSQRNLPDALRILHRTELDPRRVYITAGDGSYKEVQL